MSATASSCTATCARAGGSYYVRHLILEPQSVLITTSPVNLFVQTGFTYGGLFSGFQSSTVTYMGTSTLYLEAPASLSRLFVPAARLVVRGHLRAGQIVARDLVVDELRYWRFRAQTQHTLVSRSRRC